MRESILRAGRQYVYQGHGEGHFRPVPTNGRRKGKVWGGLFLVEFDRDMVATTDGKRVEFLPADAVS